MAEVQMPSIADRFPELIPDEIRSHPPHVA
jgi:hypothetical protein